MFHRRSLPLVARLDIDTRIFPLESVHLGALLLPSATSQLEGLWVRHWLINRHVRYYKHTEKRNTFYKTKILKKTYINKMSFFDSPNIYIAFTPFDCGDILQAGFQSSAVYSIYISGDGSATQVHCDMETAGGGWLASLNFFTFPFVINIIVLY